MSGIYYDPWGPVPQAAIAAVSEGRTVDCTKEWWPEVRRALQIQAGKWIDQGQDMRAQIALSEVKRLDAKLAE